MEQMQKLTDRYVKEVDKCCESKQKDLMEI